MEESESQSPDSTCLAENTQGFQECVNVILNGVMELSRMHGALADQNGNSIKEVSENIKKLTTHIRTEQADSTSPQESQTSKTPLDVTLNPSGGPVNTPPDPKVLLKKISSLEKEQTTLKKKIQDLTDENALLKAEKANVADLKLTFCESHPKIETMVDVLEASRQQVINGDNEILKLKQELLKTVEYQTELVSKLESFEQTMDLLNEQLDVQKARDVVLKEQVNSGLGDTSKRDDEIKELNPDINVQGFQEGVNEILNRLIELSRMHEALADRNGNLIKEVTNNTQQSTTPIKTEQAQVINATLNRSGGGFKKQESESSLLILSTTNGKLEYLKCNNSQVLEKVFKKIKALLLEGEVKTVSEVRSYSGGEGTSGDSTNQLGGIFNKGISRNIFLKLQLSSLSSTLKSSNLWLRDVIVLLENRRSPMGIFVEPFQPNGPIILEYVSYDESVDNPPPALNLYFVPTLSVKHCSSGLLLLKSEHENPSRFYLLKMHNNIVLQLPPFPHPDIKRGMMILFDEKEADRFRILYIDTLGSDYTQIGVFDSRDRTFRSLNSTCLVGVHSTFNGGVYWQGEVHWHSSTRGFLYSYSIENQSLRSLRLPFLIENPLVWGYNCAVFPVDGVCHYKLGL